MSDRQYWESLLEPGILAVVGAGGKTTVVSKLGAVAVSLKRPVVVTTTTKMGSEQVAPWNPYYGDDLALGEAYIVEQMKRGQMGSWFQAIAGHKVVGLEPELLDTLHDRHPNWSIVVEADGAKTKWLKAPKSHEPVIPTNTVTTIAVVNMQVLGKPLTEDYVHRIEEVQAIAGIALGDRITPEGVVRLLGHENGIFQYARGKRIVFCTGCDAVHPSVVDTLLQALQSLPLHKVVLANGYRENCCIQKVLTWQ